MRGSSWLSIPILLGSITFAGSWAIAGQMGRGLSVSLALSEQPSEPGHRLWSAEVTVVCDAGPGQCGHVRAEIRYASAGGESARIPVSETGQPSVETPFVVPLEFRDREIVVALFDTTDELRVLQYDGGLSLDPVAFFDLPNRIEALTVGDVDGDGLVEIVVGLDGNDDAHLRVFEFNHETGELEQTIVSGVLPEHIEGLTVGDADNDGKNEIVVGLEYGNGVFSRVRLYELEEQGWVESFVSAPGSLHVQDVQIGDVDGDGLNEIVASMSIGGAMGPTQIRLFRKVADEWIPENATPLYPSRSAERLIVADADGDGDQEIVTAYWTVQTPDDATMLVMIDKDQGLWSETVIDTGYVVDGLAVGDLDGDALPDVVVGETFNSSATVRGYEWLDGQGLWNLSFETIPIGWSWDVDLGDYDNDGSNEVLIGNNQLLRAMEADGTLSTLAHFPVNIDSALVADVDHDEPGNPRVCNLSPTGSCTETFLLLSGPESPAGSWVVTAHAASLDGAASGSSAAAVAASGQDQGAGGRIPGGGDGGVPPLRLLKLAGDVVRLRWSPSCQPEDLDFAIYEGQFGPLTDSVPLTCSTAGQLELELTPNFDQAYFVVVPTDGAIEGSYGESSTAQRAPSAAACRPQKLSVPVCP